jgi:hypothetical protein
MDFIRVTLGQSKLVCWIRLEEIIEMVRMDSPPMGLSAPTIIFLRENRRIEDVNEHPDEIMQAINNRFNGDQ